MIEKREWKWIRPTVIEFALGFVAFFIARRVTAPATSVGETVVLCMFSGGTVAACVGWITLARKRADLHAAYARSVMRGNLGFVLTDKAGRPVDNIAARTRISSDAARKLNDLPK